MALMQFTGDLAAWAKKVERAMLAEKRLRAGELRLVWDPVRQQWGKGFPEPPPREGVAGIVETWERYFGR